MFLQFDGLYNPRYASEACHSELTLMRVCYMPNVWRMLNNYWMVSTRTPGRIAAMTIRRMGHEGGGTKTYKRNRRNTQVAIEPILSKYHLKQVGKSEVGEEMGSEQRRGVARATDKDEKKAEGEAR